MFRRKDNGFSGVFFGKKKNGKYAVKTDTTEGHVLVVGGVGSGKSSCIAIPTLRSWGKGIFAIDIKGELYEHSSQYRKEHQRDIIKFDPLDKSASAYGYDPYFVLKHSRNPAQDATTIAISLIPLPPDTKEPFWIESAQNVLTAAILHYYAEDKSFAETIDSILSASSEELIETLCKSDNHLARYFVNSMKGMEGKTLASITTTLCKNIVQFITDSDLKDALTRQNNIRPQHLETERDIFIIIPEYLLRQWKNLVTLIINQFLNYFERRPENPKKNGEKSILFLLDEFPRLGKIIPILDGLATLRSKEIIICLIIQNMAQLDIIYGENERKVIVGTCAYKAILSADDPDTQEYFSFLAGTYEKIVVSGGESKSGVLGFPQSASSNWQKQETRFIKPHEFGIGMIENDIILFTPNAVRFEQSLTQEEYDRLPNRYEFEAKFAPFMRVQKARFDEIL